MSEDWDKMERPQQEIFRENYQRYIHRAGAEEFLTWLTEETDFFAAPASTKHHLAYPGGLVEHSVNVFNMLVAEVRPAGNEMWETVAICGLLHDICKANYYFLDYGVDGQVRGYTVRDQLPMGHGEKSVYLIQKFMQLTDEEALAIRWHMGAYDDAVKGGSRGLNEAMKYSQLVYELHAADMRATHDIERGK